MTVMNAAIAAKILGIEQMTRHQLYSNRHNAFINTGSHGEHAHLAGYFTAEELRAIVYWLENREEFGNGDSTDLDDAPVRVTLLEHSGKTHDLSAFDKSEAVDTIDPNAEPRDSG